MLNWILVRLRYYWPALVLLGLACSMRAAFFTGLLASDDTSYAADALAMMRGAFPFGSDMTAMRIALVSAAAASFTLLGVSEWALALPAWVASIITVLTVHSIGSLIANRRAGIIAGFLYAISPLAILNSSSLLPEAPMVCLMSLAVLFLLLALRARTLGLAAALSLGSGVAAGLGYLVKEPAVFIIAAFALTGFIQLAKRERNSSLYFLPIVGFALVFMAEIFAYLAYSGELFHRFRGIARYQAAAVTGSEQERQLQSLWLYPRSMFVVVNQVGLLFYFLVGLATVALVRKWRTPWILIFWALIPFFYLEFGSTSLTSYNALPKQPRYLEVVLPPVVILLGVWMADWIGSARTWSRRSAFALICVYVLTSIILTVVSYIDRRATVQPIRDTATYLTAAGLRPIYATPRIANGLWWFRSAASVNPEITKACVGCTSGPCSLAGPNIVGEVWALPTSTRFPAELDAAECNRWYSEHTITTNLPGHHQRVISILLQMLIRAPLPHAVAKETAPLYALLEPKLVIVNIPSETLP